MKSQNLRLKQKAFSPQQYIQNRRLESDFVFLETLVTKINELISSIKYYENLVI